MKRKEIRLVVAFQQSVHAYFSKTRQADQITRNSVSENLKISHYFYFYLATVLREVLHIFL
jgi:hypothetical protein